MLRFGVRCRDVVCCSGHRRRTCLPFPRFPYVALLNLLINSHELIAFATPAIVQARFDYFQPFRNIDLWYPIYQHACFSQVQGVGFEIRNFQSFFSFRKYVLFFVPTPMAFA